MSIPDDDSFFFSFFRMKCTVAFLVLSMVILMAEPGECIWDAVFHGGIVFEKACFRKKG